MKRLIITSNRLPVKIQEKNNKFIVNSSEGGLATGLKSYHKNHDSLWIGWPGIDVYSDRAQNDINNLLAKEHCLPVFLDQYLIENFYDGFSNTTLWPLFHYFAEYTEFNDDFWEAYKKVNDIFADAILANVNDGDTVWVHDYQLLLLPGLLKNKKPDLRIGFFLHIPFPSFEMFRILPWREEIIEGMLGADLIGFHTYDYARHFISSVKRLLGHDIEFNKISLENRKVFIDVFPMGIDYAKFQKGALQIQSKPIQERSKEHQDIDRFLLSSPERKLILSIDRLDYTKGIPVRLKAFRRFLMRYPEYQEKVSLLMLTVPSRVDVEQYQSLKSEVEELVGSINGEFGTLGWNPVIYFYRSLPFENLLELYSSADVALLTPLRDGMNLVAKEFISTKINKKGVLILSEMAGASKELGEAISVNPHNLEDVSEAIYKALTMDVEEQSKAIAAMQARIERYNIHKWADEFIKALGKTAEKYEEHLARKLSHKTRKNLVEGFANSKSRVLFLDYDGTLQRFYNSPKEAVPDEGLLAILDKLAEISDLILISGRDKNTMNEWFGEKNYVLIAEHGAWIKEKNQNWKERSFRRDDWKESIKPVLESYMDRTPGSLIEEKTHSLVWHYRRADIELGVLRALELHADISNLILNQELEILEGSKVIEIKVSGINKGTAAKEYLKNAEHDFIMAVGDDWTDEYLFKELPEKAFTIKVGTENSAAKYYLDSYKDVRELIKSLNE